MFFGFVRYKLLLFCCFRHWDRYLGFFWLPSTPITIDSFIALVITALRLSCLQMHEIVRDSNDLKSTM